MLSWAITPSYTWRSILAGREIISQGLFWNIRDGSFVLPNLQNRLLHAHDTAPRELNLVRDLFHDHQIAWDEPLVRIFFCEDVARMILTIPLSSTGQKDCPMWKFTRNGVYSVRSGYWVAKTSKDALTSRPSSSSTNPETWRWIWSICIPPKIKILLWRCLKGVLPTRNNLLRRGINVDPICVRCGLQVETHEHALRDCDWSQFFCSASMFRLRTHVASTLIPIQDWILGIVKNKDPEYVGLFAIHLWMIWRLRNVLIFQQSDLNHQSCFTIASSIYYEYVDGNTKSVIPANASYNTELWEPPMQGMVKLNSDASVRKDSFAGIGGVLRDCDGKTIKAYTQRCAYCSDVVAEALSCLRGILLARGLGIQQLVVETDNQELAQLLSNGSTPSYVGTIIGDIRSAVSELSHVEFRWIRRSANLLAHKLAHFAYVTGDEFVVLDVLPPHLQSFVLDDNVG